jgi:hypothetical protein
LVTLRLTDPTGLRGPKTEAMRLARARWQRAELASGHKYWLVWGLESQWMLPLGQTSWIPEAPFRGGKNIPARHG